MRLYYLTTCDRAGRVLDNDYVQAGNVLDALAAANRRVFDRLEDVERGGLDPKGRVDIQDRAGKLVARLLCAEAIAARS